MRSSGTWTHLAAGRESSRSDVLVGWARSVASPVALGEVEARIILADGRLEKAVRARAPGGAPATDQHPARWVRRAALVGLPVVPLLVAPGKHSWSHTVEGAVGFGMVTAICFTAAAILQLVLLVLWVARPLLAGESRVISALATLAVGVILPVFLLMAGVIGLTEGGKNLVLPVVLPFLAALVLSAVNLRLQFSRRTFRHRETILVEEMRRKLSQDPDPDGTGTGPRGPVRQLRRVIRRFPDAEQQALRHCCDRVLGQLRGRGLITPHAEDAAAARPLGSWHVLDR